MRQTGQPRAESDGEVLSMSYSLHGIKDLTKSAQILRYWPISVIITSPVTWLSLWGAALPCVSPKEYISSAVGYWDSA